MTTLPNKEEIKTTVLSITQEQTHYSPEELKLDADLEGDMGIDSLTFLHIMDALNKKFHIPTESVTIRDCSTLEKIVDYISKNMQTETSEKPKKAKPVEKKPAKAATPKSKPPAETKTDNFLGEIISQVTGKEIDENDTFIGQGISETHKQLILQKVMGNKKVPAVITLDSCDTPGKIKEFLQAAQNHGTVELGCDISQNPSLDQLENDNRSMRDFVEWQDSDLFAKTHHFCQFFKEFQSKRLFWYGMPLESACKNRAVIYDEVEGRRREFIIMASNNYLGLANHPKVIKTIEQAYRKYGATNTGCRIIGGTNYIHKELERRLAQLKCTEACIVFPSGYSANLGTISALVGRNDVVITDKVNHMSILDGCKLAAGQIKIYQHNDMNDLEKVLQNCQEKNQGKLIVTDGVFSMHGDICNLPVMVKLARKYGAKVLVDDAHATGVIGRTGAGTSEHFDMKGEVDLELGTLSKTLSAVGGFVAGKEEVIDYLRYYANSYVFAATIPAGVAAGVIAALDVMKEEPERLHNLWKNITYFKEHLKSAGFDLGDTQSAIIPVLIGKDIDTLKMGRAVRAKGLFCQTVVFPGVSKDDGRLRLSLMAEHTREDLDLTIEILIDCGKEQGLI